jgi:hypothetical protein
MGAIARDKGGDIFDGFGFEVFGGTFGKRYNKADRLLVAERNDHAGSDAEAGAEFFRNAVGKRLP